MGVALGGAARIPLNSGFTGTKFGFHGMFIWAVLMVSDDES